MTSSERRLHPASVFFDFLETVPRSILPMAVLLFSARSSGAWIWVLLVAGGVVVLLTSASVLRYLRFTYRYEEQDLVVRSGLFVRNERRIPYVRIQNIDARRNLLHRALGVAAVYVQTGSGIEPEAKLRVLPVEALDEMRARIPSAGNASVTVPGDATGEAGTDAVQASAATVQRRTLLRLTPRDLVIAGFIENRGLVLIAGALALLQQIGQTERYAVNAIDGSVRNVIARWSGGIDIPVVRGALLVLLLVFVLLLFVRMLSVIWAMIRLFDFRLDHIGDELHTEYGLFTRVTATIPLRRVQTIIVREGVVHRMIAMRSVAVETAGSIVMGDGVPAREPIAPIIPSSQVPALLAVIQPGIDLDAISWQPVHERAFGRMLRGSAFWPLVISIVAFLLVREWAAGIWIAAAAYPLVHARLRMSNLGWSLTNDYLAVRDGALTRTIRVARYNRLQVAALRRNPFDLRTGMASVHADTAGALRSTRVPYLPLHTASELHDELVTRAAATGFTW